MCYTCDSPRKMKAGSVIKRYSGCLLVCALFLTLWLPQPRAQVEELLGCLGPESEARCSELLAERSLFPPGAFGDFRSATFTLLWYSNHLAAMGEPALLQTYDQASEVYRFLWLRTFHRPVALRLQHVEDVRTLAVKELNGAGGYEPGILVVDKSIEIGDHEWNTFVQLLDESNYWNAATRDFSTGLDGAQWILESIKDGKYHIVDRWSPHEKYSSNEDLKIREACLYLLELSGLQIHPVY